MSQEFEKIVLEKLDKMDAFSMNKQKHAEYDDLFLHHNKKCQDFDIRLFKLETDMKKIKTA